MRHYDRIQALLGKRPGQVLALEGRGDRLRLAAVPDARLDVVISQGALASAEDVTAILDEIKRALRPGGRLLFVEPVAAPAGSCQRRLQWLLAPLWRRSVHLDQAPRDLWNDLRAARFGQLSLETFEEPGLMGIGVPHITGVATARAKRSSFALDTLAPSLNASSPRALTAVPLGFFG